jgi:hypothetical protein
MPLIDCPRCRQSFEVTVESFGTWIECPSCGMGFGAPSPPPVRNAGQPMREIVHVPIVLTSAPSNRRGLLWALLGAVAVVVVIVVVAESVHGPIHGPDDSWTHQDLINHLRSNGLKFGARPYSTGGLLGGPSMFFFRPGKEWEAKTLPLTDFLGSWDGIVLVELMKSNDVAREKAGVMGTGGFAWGRFLFRGDPAFLSEIRQHL